MTVDAEIGRSFTRAIRALKVSRRLRRPPLLAHLVAFALTILVPALLVGAFLILQFSRQQEEIAAAQVNDTAEFISNSVDREIYGMMTAGRVLAASPTVERSDLPAFKARTAAALVDTDLSAVLVGPDLETMILANDTGWSSAPSLDMDTAREVFATRQPRVSDVFVSRDGNNFRFAVYLPVIYGSGVPYVLSLVKNVEALGGVIADRDLPRAWSTIIKDREGHRVFAASSAGGRMESRRAVSYDNPSIVETYGTGDPGEMIEASVVSSLTGWTTTVAVPSSVVGQPVMRSWRVLIGASLLQLAFSVAVVYVFGRRIAVPMVGLARQAEAIGRGQPTTAIATHIEEISDVSKVLFQASRARREAEEQNRFLMREMTHRAKNQYALIGAIARRAAKDSADTNQFLATLSEALASLARSADLLAGSGWDSASMEGLVETQLKAFGAGGPHIVARGPAVNLNPTAAQTLGLAFHEMATNAAKYGALSCDTGQVSIEWRLGERFEVTWIETGGPPVVPPKRSGFGTLVTQKMTARGLGGDVEMTYEPSGVRWHLSAPADAVLPR
ncbi:sensor histidine kinase [Aurantimonas sp. Leaf443]|uniref:sensor histidine kinase n=1 Tax=Aurantimonas sp. Leaf443 TaxID=1736378 RepID=UPI0006FEC9DC|nr:sensor histidine kinase [Aurantimonas sp. Leaf443]KQT85965.1 hypothetical protein ASG48_05070 [Aurantimonas sp. Leaf443]